MGVEKQFAWRHGAGRVGCGAALQGDTRLIADEMDELAHGAVGKLIWEGAGTDKVSVATAADTTGYHKVLASLTGFQERLRQAADPGQP